MSKSPLLKISYKSLFYSIFMLVAMVLLNRYLDGSFWDGLQISQSAVKVEYCEFNNTQKFIHQEMNTYSNLAYFFFGVFIIQLALFDHRNQLTQFSNKIAQFPLISALLGFCFVYLSFGSSFFHASLTWLGQRVDMNGTYGLTLVLISIGLHQVLVKNSLSKKQQYIWLTVITILILAFYKIALLISSSILLPALILLLLVLTGILYFQNRKESYGIIAILSFVLLILAFKIRTLDVQKVSCDPYSSWQGHAIWHLLTALSSFSTYAFFRFKKSIVN